MDELLETLIVTQPIDGRYLSTWDPPFDEFLNKTIEDEAVKEDISQVNLKNAGRLLFIIWKNARGFTAFGNKHPSSGFEEAQCNDYANGDPDLIPLLAEVHRRKAYAWLCDHFPTVLVKTSPLLNNGYIEVLLSTDVEPKLKALLHTYLENNTQLPLWQSQSTSDEIRNHISSLKIPKTSEASRRPSLLLHRLGQPSHDTKLADRVKNLFRAGSQWTAICLCNAPGSGKTRLLLEGLCYYWGLYFTARTGIDGIGSTDLERILEELELQQRLTIFTEENHSSALDADREVSSRQFLPVLYVRLLVLRVFLDCASAMPGGITEEHKNRWLLLQVAPGLLPATPDIFHDLTQRFRQASFPYLQSSVRTELQKIQCHVRQPLFCVLDEAQIPRNMSLNCSRSDIDQEPQPLLRQIIFSWKIWLQDLIVSGTGVSVQDLQIVFRSAVGKEDDVTPETFTDLGAFDDDDTQRTYLEQYLPTGSLQSQYWKEVSSRVNYWLHGRHRFTATYLSLLIQANFELPHRVLNDFVFSMTGFHPSDKDDGGEISVGLAQLHPFNFSNLDRDPPLLRRIAGLVFDYIFYGKPRDVGIRPIYGKLVEYGVARFGAHRNILADEPLALLAAVQYFNTRKDWDLQRFLLEGLSDSNESARDTAAVDVQSLTTDTLEQQTLIWVKEKVQEVAIQAAQQRQRRRQLGVEANIPGVNWE